MAPVPRAYLRADRGRAEPACAWWGIWPRPSRYRHPAFRKKVEITVACGQDVGRRTPRGLIRARRRRSPHRGYRLRFDGTLNKTEGHGPQFEASRRARCGRRRRADTWASDRSSRRIAAHAQSSSKRRELRGVARKTAAERPTGAGRQRPPQGRGSRHSLRAAAHKAAEAARGDAPSLGKGQSEIAGSCKSIESALGAGLCLACRSAVQWKPG